MRAPWQATCLYNAPSLHTVDESEYWMSCSDHLEYVFFPSSSLPTPPCSRQLFFPKIPSCWSLFCWFPSALFPEISNLQGPWYSGIGSGRMTSYRQKNRLKHFLQRTARKSWSVCCLQQTYWHIILLVAKIEGLRWITKCFWCFSLAR